MLTIPTVLTIARILSIGPLVWALCEGWWDAALLCFGFSVLTDVLDGYLARLLHQESFLGACLDPLADKMLIVSSYGALLYRTGDLYLPDWFVQLVVIKEVILIVGALWFGLMQRRVAIVPSWWGKGAMVAQSVLMGVLFCGLWFQSTALLATVETLVWIAAGMVAGALITYAYTLARCLVRGVEYGY